MPERITDILICEKCGAQNQKGDRLCRACAHPLNRDYYRGLWLKNTLITLAIFLMPCLILFMVINRQITFNFQQQIKSGLDYAVDVNFGIIRSFFDERQHDIMSLARTNLTEIRAIRSQDYHFRAFLREKPWFDFIAVADLEGDIVYSTRPLAGNIKTRDYFQSSKRGEYFISRVFKSDILDTTALIISLPVLDQKQQIIGVILASISLKNFYQLIIEFRLGQTSEIFLADSQGRFLSPSRLGGEVLEDQAFFPGEKNPHTGERGNLIHTDYRGQKVLCAYRRSLQPDWYVVSEIDLNEALAPLKRLKKIMLQVFILFSFFLVLSSFLYSRQILRSLKNITRNLKQALDEISDKKNTINTINIELRKRLQECQTLSRELSNSETQTKNIINHITGGLMAFDHQYRITYLNEAMKDFCIKDHAVIGQDARDALPLLKEPDVQSGIESVFQSETPFRIPKRERKTGTGSEFVTLSVFAVQHPDQNPAAILFLEDITEQEFLRRQMDDYEKLSALSQLALGAAHEINNPLQGITSYLELLREEEKDQERRQRIQEVLDNAYRISETVRGLLNYTRPSPPKFTRVDINTLIQETVSFLHHQPLFKKVEIVQQLPEELPQITADVNQLRQILINILLNAAQAMPGGRGRITVQTSKMKFEDQIQITIADTGIGISPENLPRIFEPFFTTKKSTGTGLGLSISQNYVKNHDGEITIKSTVGAGTTVTIVLPVRQTGKDHQEVIE